MKNDVNLDKDKVSFESLDRVPRDNRRLANYNRVLKIVNNIVEYCSLYNFLPRKGCYDYKTNDGMTSDYLSKWLYNTGYYDGNFKYSDVVNENGVFIIDILDKLHKEYKKIAQRTDEYALLQLSKIEEYCWLYKEWPKRNNKKNKISDGTTSDQLIRWLEKARYGTENFRYNNVVDENGVKIVDILNKLNVIYSTTAQSINKIEVNDRLFNLRNAEKSKELGLKLYYIVVKMMNSYYIFDVDEFNNYYNGVKCIITANNINISLEEIVSSFDLSSSELKDYYYKKYTISSIWNDNVLAEFYKCLYNYMDMINVTRCKSRGKNK